jgi:hypothetical protein
MEYEIIHFSIRKRIYSRKKREKKKKKRNATRRLRGSYLPPYPSILAVLWPFAELEGKQFDEANPLSS